MIDTRTVRTIRRALGALLACAIPVVAVADAPIASSSFVGAEDPLFENGRWAAITSLAPSGTRFQKNNGAYPDRLTWPDHAGARTTVAVPADHYSEIVVGHLGSDSNNVGPSVRVQSSGLSTDSHYLWWASLANGINGLYRIDANGITYSGTGIIATSPAVDGDRLRLIARGPVIYGVKNGVRDFIYNTGPDGTRYSAGTTGILAYPHGAETDAVIASWSTGPAPVSSGTWASTNFAGAENPLDEGDRWYPLPGYSGFRKAGGLAVGRDAGHNASGVWGIAPPARQYSEVTLGTVAGGGGGPIVRIDRTNAGQTGWLLFLSADPSTSSGIYKMTPDGGFSAARLFIAPVVSGDRWRLSADGNTLEVFRNGVSQFTFTTDGSYPTGDVGIDALTSAFTFMAWEGGETQSQSAAPDTRAPTAPGMLTTIATSGSQITLLWTAAADDTGVTAYLVERCQGPACAPFTQIATATDTTYTDTRLAANTTYSYRVRATDATGNLGPYSNTASATTLPF
jgi:fibronectin type III domain protein